MQAECEEGEWSTPNRAIRSPVKRKNLEFGQVSILSNLRFSVLSDTDQAVELVENTNNNEATTEVNLVDVTEVVNSVEVTEMESATIRKDETEKNWGCRASQYQEGSYINRDLYSTLAVPKSKRQ